MSHLTHSELRNGIWLRRLEGISETPAVIVTYQGVEIAGVSVKPIADNIFGAWTSPYRLRCCQTVFTAV
jgi:hypothetical protein